MTATLTDERIGIIDDTTHSIMGAPPCEVPAGCDQTARFACTMACCAQMVLICDNCMDIILEGQKASKEQGLTAKCLWCKAVVEPFKMFVSVTRL